MPIKDFDVVSSVGGRNYFVVKDLTPKPYPLVGGNHEYTYNLKPNTTYTISTTGAKGSTFRVNGIRVSYSITGDKGYRVTTDSSGVLRIGLYARNGETDQFIDGSARLKLEEGNIATDWTPAPEDITFDLRNKSIYVGSQKIESAYLGDTHIYGEPDIVEPFAITPESDAAMYDFTNGYIHEYFPASGNISPINWAGAGVFDESGFRLNKTVYTTIDGTAAVRRNQSTYTSITFKVSEASEGTIYTQSTAGGDVVYRLEKNGNEARIVQTSRNGLGSSTQRSEYYDTEFMTVDLEVYGVHTNNYSNIWINGEHAIYNSRQTVNTYSAPYIYSNAGLIYDFKIYGGSPYQYNINDELIMTNYQNVQERLKTL